MTTITMQDTNPAIPKIKIDTFTCLGCGHELPSNFCMRTPNYCYLCDPNVTVDELLAEHEAEQNPKP